MSPPKSKSRSKSRSSAGSQAERLPFWKARYSKHGQHGKNGRPRIFESAEELREACQEYFEWVDSNPLKEEKLFAYMGDVTRDEVSHPHAMTLKGLCIFLDIDVVTWYRWSRGELGQDYSKICQLVENVIYQQKFTAASAGLLNPSIIARELGLAEHQDVRSGDGSMTPKAGLSIDPAKLSNEALREVIAAARSPVDEDQGEGA